MPVPEFILALRQHVGHAMLPLVGVSAVVRDARGHILCLRRADTGQWSLVSGILEPGEEPVAALVREVWEETAVSVDVGSLTSVLTLPPLTYPNGDQAQYLDLCFLAQHAAGEACVNDDESLAVGWFGPDALPPLAPLARHRVELALGFTGEVAVGRLTSEGYAGWSGSAARGRAASATPRLDP
jgi:8-oxo-dGTP pyrophosphatase MutT (NUDIX family)